MNNAIKQYESFCDHLIDTLKTIKEEHYSWVEDFQSICDNIKMQGLGAIQFAIFCGGDYEELDKIWTKFESEIAEIRG